MPTVVLLVPFAGAKALENISDFGQPAAAITSGLEEHIEAEPEVFVRLASTPPCLGVVVVSLPHIIEIKGSSDQEDEISDNGGLAMEAGDRELR
ncbi:hypothetical protein HS088_TW05G00204 [Tripterygium wilfordii]|uniref:Uncharacterized protein n=1 Tax=Tripterygium wilfordii TaxID=458696 RepID=A0A7J7DMG8_TRIWF|nr:hypothetical protein HS088_TW05G00204 [Tripterygium wilfordii]